MAGVVETVSSARFIPLFLSIPQVAPLMGNTTYEQRQFGAAEQKRHVTVLGCMARAVGRSSGLEKRHVLDVQVLGTESCCVIWWWS